jgi:YbbR domain-containing protein
MAVRLFQHFGLKLLSISLALLLWGLVAGQREAERSLRVPLEYRNIPDHLEMLGEPESLVDVRVRGTSGALGQLRGADLVAVLDLSTARPGKRLFHLIPGDISVPTGVSVLQVTPSTVGLTFETADARQVPVVPVVDDEPAPGFVVGRVVADPATVDVVGPSSAVKQVTEATTEPVSIRGATQTVRDTVTVGLPDSVARLRNPRSAVVTVEILPAPVERQVEGVPVTLRNLGEGLRGSAAPETVTVMLAGPPRLVSSLRPEQLQVYVDLTGLAPGRYNLPVRYDALPDLSVLAADPANVDVRLR